MLNTVIGQLVLSSTLRKPLWQIQYTSKTNYLCPLEIVPKYLTMKITLFAKEKTPQPDIRFGRYSDAYKDAGRYVFWDKAVLMFEQKQYLTAFEALFDYLYDPDEDNVKHRREGDNLYFEVVQGSKKIIGTVAPTYVTAEIDVVRCTNLSLPFMRRLVEMNFDFQFCRFALHNDTVYLKYDTHTADALPEKIYLALREMATQADKYDDLFVASFPHVMPSQYTTQIPLPEQEQAIKYAYLQRWISNASDLIHRLDANAQAVAISYILLNTALKIDYLVVPQGNATDKIEFINELYYTESDTTILERNTRSLRELMAIQQFSPEDLQRELYQVQATFGLASYAQPHIVIGAIGSIINDIAQCADRRYPAITQHITECAVQYALFHLGMPPCLRCYLHFIVQCLNADYFKELGFTPNYADLSNANAKPNAKPIKQTLAELQKNAQITFPDFAISISSLQFKTLLEFIHSLLQALSRANYRT